MFSLDKKIVFEHPELQEGEVLFTNSDEESFHAMNYDTKRRGINAYDGEGNRQNVDNWFPVFLKTKELERKDFDLMEIRRAFWKRRE